MKKITTVLLASSIIFASCDKNKNTTPTTDSKGSVVINIAHKVGSENFQLGDKYFTNANGDSYQVNMYKYYISNVSLVNDAGGEVKIPESYYLIDESKASSKSITIADVPTGNYTKIKFLIGVDSTRNVSGVQSGALDPSNGMFWTWSTGYIMAKIEGSSPQSGSSDKSFALHIGGFKSKFCAIQQVELPFPSATSLSSSKSLSINLSGDVNKWFEGKANINLATTYHIMGTSAMSETIAQNYKNMFTISSVQ